MFLDFLRKGILSDVDIMQELDRKRIVVSPLHPHNVSINSVDIRLDNLLLISTGGTYRATLNPFTGFCQWREDGIEWKKIDLSRGKYLLQPGEFVLGSTFERIGSKSPKIVADIADKSSLARMGLAVCAKSGWVDPGNVLNVTLEISNRGKNVIELHNRMHIAQVVFHYQNSESSRLYKGKYQGSDRPVGAK